MDWESIFAVLFSTFAICVILMVIAIPEIIKIAFEKQLFDVPDYRKVHTGRIPRLGGVAFLPGIMIAVFLAFSWMGNYGVEVRDTGVFPEIMLGAAATLFLYMAGVADDLLGLSYKVKFPIQILSALLLCSAGLWIGDFYGLLGIHRIPGWIGVPFTVVVIVLIINAINLIDGIDGLASGLCIIGIAAFTVFFLQNGLMAYAVIGVASLGALLPFYIYNVYGTSEKRTKIFMGDAGSLTMGYIISAFAIKAATFSDDIPGLEDRQTSFFVYSFAVLIVPVLDVLRLFFHRIIHRRSPFEPDRCHIHHKFLAIGLTIGQARHLIIGISLLFFLGNIILIKYIDINILIVVDIAVWTLIHILISRRIKTLQSEHAESAKNYLE